MRGPFYQGPLKFASRCPFGVQEGSLSLGRVPQWPRKCSNMVSGAIECIMWKWWTQPKRGSKILRVLFRNLEGPRLVCVPIGVGSCALRYPWYVFSVRGFTITFLQASFLDDYLSHKKFSEEGAHWVLEQRYFHTLTEIVKFRAKRIPIYLIWCSKSSQ